MSFWYHLVTSSTSTAGQATSRSSLWSRASQTTRTLLADVVGVGALAPDDTNPTQELELSAVHCDFLTDLAVRSAHTAI